MRNYFSVLTTVSCLAILGVGNLAHALPASFADATAIPLTDNAGQATGAVSSGHNVFEFEAEADSVVTIDVNVTAVLPGADYEDDDSQLFLFDATGQLIAENDDESEDTFESLLADVTLPNTGTYYVVVTTWDNDPILSEDGIVTDWPDNGGSSIEYDLLINFAE